MKMNYQRIAGIIGLIYVVLAAVLIPTFSSPEQYILSSSAAEKLSEKFEADGDIKIIKQQIESMEIRREENQKWHAFSLMIIAILSLALALRKGKPEQESGQPATLPRAEDHLRQPSDANDA